MWEGNRGGWDGSPHPRGHGEGEGWIPDPVFTGTGSSREQQMGRDGGRTVSEPPVRGMGTGELGWVPASARTREGEGWVPDAVFTGTGSSREQQMGRDGGRTVSEPSVRGKGTGGLGWVPASARTREGEGWIPDPVFAGTGSSREQQMGRDGGRTVSEPSLRGKGTGGLGWVPASARTREGEGINGGS